MTDDQQNQIATLEAAIASAYTELAKDFFGQGIAATSSPVSRALHILRDPYGIDDD